MDPSGDGGGGLTTAELPCGACGAELPPNSKFCNECGAAVTRVSRPAEYKQVTVLFADMVRSMDIAAAVDMERLREIVTDLVERSAAVVRRYGGSVEFTGDGVMAIFGAPVALEDHAVRACLAAVGVQEEAKRLAVEVRERDGVELQVRVGLNSGRVIAGEIGSGALGYAAIGEQVGMAQRMESVAPPGGVMLSASTARLVDRAAALGEPELVRIKGADQPVAAQRLVGIEERHRLIERAESELVGRRWELSAVEGVLDRAVEGHGAVVGFVGPPGIGKSRLVREVSAMAGRRGVEVFTAFCESHASQVPFHAVARLLRAATGVEDLDAQAARDRVRARVPDADPEDLLLFDDLLGIADPDVAPPKIDPDARRRRLTALVNAASLARETPAVYVVEDAHWIDEVSESMLVDFLTVIAQTPSLALVTYRPEYEGALTRMHGTQTIALGPLSDPETAALVSDLLGPDPSVVGLGQRIAERAAGNPFFAEEMVRDLAEREVLRGQRGSYISMGEVAEVNVPATLQAAIAARIDRLEPDAKKTLTAAAVIGSRFTTELLAAVGDDPVVEELLNAELIDQIRFTPSTEFAFRHPLIRTVAYESQLKSDRARLHRRLAAAIEQHDPGSTDGNAALIAEHLEAAGDLPAAYGWHMRAGAWSANRDLDAARVSWERARRIADALPADDPDQLSMRVAPRTMLCATDWQARAVQESRGRFAELRELCRAAGDKVSLAIGMSGLSTELLYAGRSCEGARLASEQMALLESIGDPTMTMGLAFMAFANWFDVGEFGEILRWSQTVVDLAEGDPAKGAGFGVGSPLAVAVAFRGVARWWLGRPGWRQDLDDAVAMARRSDPATSAAIVAFAYGMGIAYGVRLADDSTVRAIEEAVRTAERASNHYALSIVKYALGAALLSRGAAADRQRGLELMVQAGDTWRERAPFHVPTAALWAAREMARRGDRDAAIPVMRKAVDDLHEAGRLGLGVGGTGILVQTLLQRGAEGDLAEAQRALDRLQNLRADQGSAMREITLLGLRALISGARGDTSDYRDYRDRYRAMATSLGFEGHMKWAEAMP